MAQHIIYAGRRYRPTLWADGRIQVRATGAYTGSTQRQNNAGINQLMLTVYVLCAKARAREKAPPQYHVVAMREYVPITTTPEEQTARLKFMLDVVAVRCEADYHELLPISVRPVPKYAQTKSKGE